MALMTACAGEGLRSVTAGKVVGGATAKTPSAPTPPTLTPPTTPPTQPPAVGSCTAGSSFDGTGWPSADECNRKLNEGSFSGSCDYNTDTKCYGIPSLPPGNPPVYTDMPPGPYPQDGEGILNYVRGHWGQYLAPTSNLAQRQANMAFLRDRIIEVGKCAGVDLGLNLKRGGPDISIDFLAGHVDGRTIGVDIGFDYDNIGETLRLQWIVYEGASYAAYPGSPICH